MKNTLTISASDFFDDIEEYEYGMPYTDEELVMRAEKGRRQIADGKYYTNEEVFRMLEDR